MIFNFFLESSNSIFLWLLIALIGRAKSRCKLLIKLFFHICKLGYKMIIVSSNSKQVF